MSGTIAGYILDTATGELLFTPQVTLTRTGVAGESLTQADELGRFAFRSLTPGGYNLGIYDDRYVPLYRDLILEEGTSIEDLRISLTPAAFIKGQILDEDGVPPQHCHFTLIRAGNRRGKSGYISDSGDHAVDKDGHFASPPLRPGRYCLRFAGVLRKHFIAPQTTPWAMQERIFDFVYPNVQDVVDAVFFDLEMGQTLDHIEVRIPRPIWRTVRGRLTGALPDNLADTYVHFARDVGMIDDFGSMGVKVDSLGAFEGPAQPGRYRLFVWEMTPPDQDGYTQRKREFSSAEVTVGAHDTVGVEIQITGYN
ncbi:carboxypeptidase-like regulatory domain-containing protein [Granulicella sp. WH15]|uniref:carboxypeptidase-like regulatory domain-containing protein n=1 Tax=Granulicella sp. WH15 TaxID=2602070 RepID=UPI0013671A49|nr:carboxypeptidase-like regulatory domain-containing protein [Granulicella sp. WH15]QHN03012.1 carboxypeptidase-like regulatory domain-containing protein [Granulicella sp. WH15]